jgi:hypothetical protein
MHTNSNSLSSVDVSTEIQHPLALYLHNMYSASMRISGRTAALTLREYTILGRLIIIGIYVGEYL